MDFALVRHYVHLAPRADAEAVMRDAVVVEEPSAVELLRFVLQVRVNKRTRRSLGSVAAAYATNAKPRWLGHVQEHLFNLYRLTLDRKECPRRLFTCVFIV